MTTIEFLSLLSSLDVKLWINGDQLRYRAPQGVMTADLRAELARRKGEIFTFLREVNTDLYDVALPLRPALREGALPLSFAQQRLWFLDQLVPNSSIYTLSTAVRLTGQLDVAALARSLSAIVRRHEALRTTFPDQDGQPIQVIAPAYPVPLPVIGLQTLPKAEREAAAARLAGAEARLPFDLANEPLVRTTLLRLDEEEHMVLLTMHHIISDAWSEGVFMRELAALYAAYTTGQPAILPELPIQYADYAVWQRQWLVGELLEAHLAHWRAQLADLPVLELPTDYPRPPVTTFQGARLGFELPLSLTQALVTLSRAEGVTLFMTLLAAWKLLLARYSGQDDVTVGTPIAGRTRKETEPLIGFFVNTLVLRTDLSGHLTFRELLQRVRTVCLSAYAHQDLPFEQVVEALQPARDLSRNPLFQVTFMLETGQHVPIASMRFPGLRLQRLAVEHETTRFDLGLLAEETAAGLVGMLHYRTDLFKAATITRMLGHFHMLLEGIAAAPERHLADLPLLTDAERQQILVAWNATQAPYSHDQCIHHLFEAQAARTPDAIAVVFDDRPPTNDHRPTTNLSTGLGAGDQGLGIGDWGLGNSQSPIPNPQSPSSSPILSPQSSVLSPHCLSYHELNARANHLAHYLRNLGVGPEVPVGLCVERSVELVIGVLGILKAGGAYVPLDPAYPPERLAFMIADSQAAVLLTQQRLVGGLPTSWALAIRIDGDWDRIGQTSAANPDSGVRADNLSYVIYTSGSTGTPKGAMIRHGGLVNYLSWCTGAYEVAAGRGAPVHSSIAFDLTVTVLFAPLLVGGVVQLLPESPGDEALGAALRTTTGFSLVKLTPAHLQMLSRQLAPYEVARRARRFIIGGETLMAESVAFWRAAAPDTLLVNEYGPTETVVGCCVYQVPPGIQTTGAIPIGRPIANTQLYVLDAQKQPVPIGVVGELYIGGAGLARGYLGRPDLTAERFIPNPFAGVTGVGCWVLEDSAPNTQHPSPNTRLYRTGDLVRYQADGVLEFLGRMDHQVKVRGYRIELGEVEAVLLLHPKVRESVVVAWKGTHADTRLVAYVVPKIEDRGWKIEDSGSDAPDPLSSILYPLSSELRAFLAAKLPDYMVPATFVVLEALPLTPNGKVDRRALPTPDTSRPKLEDAFVAPRSPIEELLVDIWTEVLRLERVGVHDNFFAVGGHSLIGTQVVSRVRETFQVELPLSSLFEAPTIAGLAEQIVIARQDTPKLLPLPVRPVPRGGALPLSYAQQRLWFLDQFEPNSPVYNVPTAVRLIGPLHVAVLAQSLNDIVRRHEVLRTRFVTVDGQPVQVIAPALAVPLPLLDLRSWPLDAREAVAQRLANVEAERPFDLARGPLVRATLLRLEAQEHVALLTMHHIVSDGWSMDVLIREITTFYTNGTTGQPAQLSELPIQYADYAVWQRQWLRGAVLEAQLAYWQAQLADLLVLQLPTDSPPPPIATFGGANYSFALPQALRAELLALSRAAGATLFMTLLAAWKLLLARYSSQDDIAVGTPIANRHRAETEGLIGCFVNTLVLRTDLSGNPTFQEVLRRVRAVCLGAYTHQDLPFEQVVEALQPARDLSRHPLFQVMLTFEHASPGDVTLPDLVVQPLAVASTTTKFDLLLSLVEAADGLVGALRYRTDLFAAATIARMIGHFQTLLEGIVADPAQPLATLPLLSAAERQQLLGAGRATAIADPPDQCLHQLFEAQAVHTPDAIAVVFHRRPTTNDQRPTTNDGEPRTAGFQEPGTDDESITQNSTLNTQNSSPNTQHPTPNTQHLTYRHLDARATQLAHHLHALGVGPEVRVALCLERSLGLIIGLLGILKAGGAYVPLDPAYPQQRLAFMLEDAQVSVLLTQNRLIERLPDLAADQRPTTNDQRPTPRRGSRQAANDPAHPVTPSPRHPRLVCLDADWATIASACATNVAGQVTPANLAYVIYTSGSTGTPKGVLVSHAQVVRLLTATQDSLQIDKHDVWTLFHSVAFDFSVWEVWGALRYGGRLVLVSSEVTRTPDAFYALVSAERVTVLNQTPSAFYAFMRVAAAGYRHPLTLRLIIFGGEALDLSRLRPWFDQPGAQTPHVINMYGITETTVHVTYRRLTAADVLEASGSVIGEPLVDLQLYVLDRQQQLTPLGVPGELYVGGAGLARGYLNRPDLTAERFIPNPFAGGMGDGGWGMEAASPSPIPHPPSPGTRLYKTGDLVRYLPGGDLVYLGRLDQQVKIHGYRIELGEIEATLAQHPAIRDAVVLARQDAPGHLRLVAYVVTSGKSQVTSSEDSSLVTRHSSLVTEWRDFLKEKLPEYMVPAAFVILEALPRSPSGKLDRRRLPAPAPTRPALASTFLAPRSPLEAILAAIWAEVLHLDEVGVHDNFFALGGDSILSLQIVARASAAGLSLNPKHLFQHQTVAQLAALAATATRPRSAPLRLAGPAPLTPIQHWFVAQALPEPQHFNQALLLEVRVPLDSARLEQALQLVLRHHDALRLRLRRTAAGWQQESVALPRAPLVRRVELAGLTQVEQGAALATLATMLQSSLDLAAGSLVRVVLFTHGQARSSRLLIIIHHLAVDGVSWRIVLEDLQSVYQQLSQGAEPALPPPSTAFVEWAERLAAYAQSAALHHELAYWLDKRRAAIQRLPLDYPAGANTAASACAVGAMLNAEETAALLREVPAAYHTQINDVLLTALAQTLAAWSGAKTLLIDLEGHGREDLFDDVDLSRTVGWCTTLFPVLLDLEGVAGLAAALKVVKEQLRAVPKRGIGYGVLRYLSSEAAAAGLRQQPQAEVSFNYLGQLDQAMPTGLFWPVQEPSGPVMSQRGRRSHLLEVGGIIAGGQLHLEWTYSAQMHHRATIERLAQEYLTALRALIAHCQAPDAGGFTPSDFPLTQLDQAALDRLLGADRYVEDVYPLGPTQQGILFHTIAAAEPGVYIIQMHCVLQGDLDRAAFERAWQSVVDRHSILRSAFVWAGLATPLQIVRRQVRVPWTQQDWRALESGAQTARLASFLAADRAQGFALAQAPLLRLALFQLSATTYQFVWSHHHLLLDGWSLPLILKEVFACYAAFALGHPLLLAPPRPYRDYIAWLQHQDLSRAEAFWRATLQNFSAPTSLGLHKRGPAQAGARYAKQQLQLNPPSTAALHSLGRQQALTLNTLVQGAWALLLSRYSGSDDVLFGVTVAGRPASLPGVEQMVGLFINTLPLRVRLAPHARLLDWLAELQAQQVELRQYEYTPLVQIQRWSALPHGVPLFESIVVFENYPMDLDAAEQDDRPRLAIQDVRAVEENNYPITIAVGPGSILEIHINYDCHRFDGAMIARMLGHIQMLLEGIVADPTRRLAAVSLLTAAEQRQLLIEWNATTAAYPRDQCIHELFETQVARTPDAVAVVFDGPPTNDHRRTTEDRGWKIEDRRSKIAPFPSSILDPRSSILDPQSSVLSPQSLTYSELNARANHLAHYLRQSGIGPEVCVGLCVERSLGMVTAMLGILKAGGAYVPLDPAYPLERLSLMVNEIATPLLLTQARLVDKLPTSWGLVVCLDTEWDVVAQQSAANPSSGVRADNLAYVIYTSGSTGTPKGVQVPHRGLCNLAAAQIQAYDVQPDSHILQFVSFGFDVATSDMFTALVAGATLCLVPPDSSLPGPALIRLLDDHAITFLELPASVMASLPYENLPTLRTLIAGGEPCSSDLVARWSTGRRFFNVYGPTEATVTTTLAQCLDRDQNPPIGRPITNMQVYLLDAQLQPVPIGVPGELYISGVGLARGYLNRPGLTAERFVPNPFGGVTGDGCWVTEDSAPNTQHPTPDTRLYRTGDLARYWPDGNLEFLGRRDEQVKVRGFRIELGEIEVTLGQHRGVREAVVLVREDVPGEKRLMAYIVPKIEDRRLKIEDSNVGSSERLSSIFYPLSSELRDFLNQKLPDYMVPAGFALLEALPRMPNGKVDRRALSAVEQARPGPDDTFVAPRTPAEALLVQIWAEVLRVEHVSVRDNFFALGGHSLLATGVISRIRDTFQVELPIHSLFEAPTIAGLAEQIATARRGAPGLLPPPLQSVQRDGALPLSYAQQRLWFLDQLQPDSHVYNIPTAVYLTGPLDTAALAQTISAIVRRHEALRTTFAAVDGQPVQLIAPPRAAPLALIDLQALPADACEHTVRQLAAIETQRSFDLARGPLLRTTLLRLYPQEHVVLLTMHHIISDARSMEVLIREITTLYAAWATGHPAALPELPIQYVDYAVWQRKWLQGEVLEAQLAYWRHHLADLPVLQLPTDHPRPAVETFGGARHGFSLPPALHTKLLALSRPEGVTLFITMLAAFQTLLAHYSVQDDIVVGTPITNRHQAETEGLIGFFLNTLVLRTDLAGNPTFQEALRRVRAVCLDAYAHQDLPFEQVVEMLQPARDLSRHPLFQVMFTLEHVPAAPPALPDLAVRSLMVTSTTTRFDLTLSLMEQSDGLEGTLEYRTDLFEATTITRMVDHFQTLLEGIVTQPAQRLAELPLLTATERQQLLLDWNATATATLPDQCIHQLFEAQVARTPDAIAVVFDRPPTTDHRPPTTDQRADKETRRQGDKETEDRRSKIEDRGSTIFHPPSSVLSPQSSVLSPEHLTYRELNVRANRLAHHLRTLGVGPEDCVGVCLKRSPELVVALLGILKAGAAYLPLDPAYPRDRLAFMLQDAQAPVLLTQSDEQLQELKTQTPRGHPKLKTPMVVRLDADRKTIAQARADNPVSQTPPDQLAYVIYTSGSTGKPKGVMITHRNVVNFFTAMNGRIGHEPPGVWLAVTSISFDIAVLELLWTLTHGSQVVIQGEPEPARSSVAPAGSAVDKEIAFSLFYFASDDPEVAKDTYHLLLEGAKYADRHGFSAIWTPERHFHAFGGVYPNPSVISAGLATITDRIQIRAGSVVLPLHNPIRVAEEWSVVDNLSKGRIGLSFASGWHADDFVFAPEHYRDRRTVMLREIETVRKLWRGETVAFRGGTGNEVAVRILPQPIQPDLPIWLTAAGSPETFRLAGEIGANLLTHLLGQSVEDLAEKIALYRAAWQQYGHGPGAGHVTLMLHTFVGPDIDDVREKVRTPFRNYLKSSLDLIKNMARSLGRDITATTFTDDDMEALLAHAFDRYFATSSLMGTPEICLEMIDQLKLIGVDEVGCLVDFGVDFDSVMASLHYLNIVRERSNTKRAAGGADYSLPAQMTRHHVSHMQCTPSMARMLTIDLTARSAFRSLTKLLLGGETLPASLVEQLGEELPAEIHNLYGPTETTIWSTTHLVGKGERTMLIGRPIANTQIYILDRHLRPVPIGVPGELYIGGTGTARGYLKRPDLTAERFVPNPFGQGMGDGGWGMEDASPSQPAPCATLVPHPPSPGTRLYKTGDRARYRPTGDIEHLGRLDTQVKVRGFRIELGEIEIALAQHAAVREAVVVVREDVPGDQRLVAYVVPTNDQRPTTNDQRTNTPEASSVLSPQSSVLRVFLKERLPDHMVPAAFVVLPRLPLTPNGKVDRRALPAPETGQSMSEGVFVAPRTPVETILAGIWAEVLRLERVGIHDNFFALGGHSLLATQLISRVRDAFRLELPLRSLFEAPSVEGLAERIARARRAAPELLIPALRPVPREDTLPLSFAQQRLWFLDQLQPNNPVYNMPAAVRLMGALDLAAFTQSVSDIRRRHEALRTTFVAVDGQPVQVIAPAGTGALTAPVPLFDLQALPEDERETTARRLAGADAQRSFDLARGPLVRTTLVRLGAQEYVVLLNMHHIVSDGWSMGVFVRELVTLYTSYTTGEPASLPELPLQYADYAIWQRHWLQGDVLEAQLAYWQTQLADLPALQLPIDRPRPQIPSFRGASQAFVLSAALHAALMLLSRAEGVTLFMTLLAAFQVLLAWYSGQDDVVVGTPIAGRTRAETEGLVGFFVNTLVLRTDLSGNPTFRALLREVREVCLEAYAHQDIPFEQIVDALQPTRDLSRNPLFQVMFALQNEPVTAVDLPSLALRPLEVEHGITHFDLSLFAEEARDGLVGALKYRTDLFDAATVERMSRHFQTLLEGIVAQPELRLAELPLLSDAERQQLLVDWNATQADFPRDQCVHHLFEVQVARTPDAIALVFDRPTTNDQRPTTNDRRSRMEDRRSKIEDRPISILDPRSSILDPRSSVLSPQSSVLSPQQLTYHELNARANQVAHHLRALGVGPEVRVGLCMERSLDLVVGMLGILKAGGAYVPLDPAYPTERLAFMLEDAQAAVLLTTTDQRPPTTDHRPSPTPSPLHPFTLSRRAVVCLDADWPSIAQHCVENPCGAERPDHLAYLIYTSGSTGRPKAVMVEHRNVVNTLCAARVRFDLRPGDCMLCMASFAFDIAVFECLGPLLLGGTCVLLTRQQVLDPPALALLVQQTTFLHMMPGLMRQLVQTLQERGDPPAYPRLRGIMIGGDAIATELVEQMRAVFPAAQIYLGYGPTEGTIMCTICRLGDDQIVSGSQIGRPLANMQVRLYDAYGRLVPVGVPGEIYIGGAGVARGYLNRPDLTAERFLPNPFWGMGDGGWGMEDAAPIPHPPSPIPRLYRTGDMARYRPDGQLEFLGRLDEQVKVRGFRIELGEVQSVLEQHPMVREAVVLAREDAPGSKRLVAYVVTSHKSQVTSTEDSSLVTRHSLLVTELRAFLVAKLPDYMVPADIVFLKALPLTSNGKVDQRALPAPTITRLALDEAFVAPRTPVEEVLVSLCARVLRLEQVSVHDNFFALGGHSLLATQLISRIRDAFQIELPLRHLFEASTMAELAEQIVIAQCDTRGLLLPPLRAIPHDGAQPLSFAQQRLWFLDQFEPNSPAYNIPAAVRLTGPLDVAAMKRSLNEIVRRHEVLRTTFTSMDGQARQVIAPVQTAPLLLLDLQALPIDAWEDTARRLANRQAQQPFDLAGGPLLRVTLLRLSRDIHVVLLTMHHIVSDAWSMDVLVRELSTLYAALAAGHPSPLPELRIQYADFAIWQRNVLQGGVLDAHLAYWQTQLADLPALQLPTDHPRLPVATFQGASYDFTLPPSLGARVRALSREEGVTLFMALLATFQILLQWYTGQDDIVVGTDVANRTRPEMEELIGFFVNQLVLRTNLSGNPTFREVLRRVREICLEASTHQDLPFDKLVEVLNPARDLSQTPLFQVKFVLQNAPMSSLEPSGLTVSTFGVEQRTAKFDLLLNMVDTAHGLSGSMEYRTDLFKHASIARMLGYFEMLLHDIVAQPDSRLNALADRLTEADRKRRKLQTRAVTEINLQHLKQFKRKSLRGPELMGEDER